MRTFLKPCLLLITFMAPYINSYAADGLELQGFGVRSCDYLSLSELRWDEGQEEGAVAYMRLQEWLSGFISGLTLATGEDVTKGAGTEGMLREVVEFCRQQENRDQDVFGAVMTLIRQRQKVD